MEGDLGGQYFGGKGRCEEGGEKGLEDAEGWIERRISALLCSRMVGCRAQGGHTLPKLQRPLIWWWGILRWSGVKLLRCVARRT